MNFELKNIILRKGFDMRGGKSGSGRKNITGELNGDRFPKIKAEATSGPGAEPTGKATSVHISKIYLIALGRSFYA